VTFPNARHDDPVDALSQFVNWIREHPPSDGLGAFAVIPSVWASDPTSPWYGLEFGFSDYDGSLL
jgi:hypothetical protein